jgi:hypothetical protein
MAIGSQEREKILALELRNSCATKHPSALLVPRRAENDKQVHGDEHGEALCVGLWQFPLLWKHLCASSIVMMEPAQDRVGEDLAACMLCWHASSFLLRNLLLNALVRSCLVEVVYIGIENPLELPLMQDEQIVEALTSHTAQEAFADRIRSRSVIRRFENLDATRLGNALEGHAKLGIVISDEILRSHPKGGGEPSLLRSPGIRRRSCDAYVNHSAGVQFDNEEGKQRAEEEIGDR